MLLIVAVGACATLESQRATQPSDAVDAEAGESEGMTTQGVPPALSQPAVPSTPSPEAGGVVNARGSSGAWLDAAAIATVIAALATAVIGAVIGGIIAWQVAVRQRADTFRELRRRFFELRMDNTNGLPVGWWKKTCADPLTVEEFKNLQRYWIFAFDEWYITKKAAPWGYEKLWNEYYREAIERTAQEPLMLLVLFVALNRSGDTAIDGDFVREVCALATPEKRAETEREYQKWVKGIGPNCRFADQIPENFAEFFPKQ
jgi:hypothetical protein